jgi:predicted outer membrane repeat protein
MDIKTNQNKFGLNSALAPALVFISFFSYPVMAATYYVNPGESIQAAIGGASYGDTIEVAEGIYVGNLTLKNGVTLVGYGAAIVSNNTGSVVFSLDCDPNTILEGFTVTNGYGGFIGGGMLNNNSSPTVTNCNFIENSTSSRGGGMANIDNSSPVVTNCAFSDNSAGLGGGMNNLNNCSPTVINCTFSGNSAGSSGGGIYNTGNSNPTIINCILWANDANTSADEIYNDSSTPAISYSDIAGCGGSGTGWDTALGTDAGGNIDADPLFVIPGLDLHLKSQFGRGSNDPTNPFTVHDLVTSPCIDAGDPNMNVGSESHVNGGRINMGVYGGTSHASRSGYNPDTNVDGIVNLLDLAILADHWLEGAMP